MQHFLPYRSYVRSASCLDKRRLGKQRIETKDSLFLLMWDLGEDLRNEFNYTDSYVEYITKRYPNHPAVLMWEGYEKSLAIYGAAICKEWIRRGFVDNQLPVFRWFIRSGFVNKTIWKAPWWLGREEFHSSHRSALLFKNIDHYSQFGWSEEPKYDYWWPTKQMEAA